MRKPTLLIAAAASVIIAAPAIASDFTGPRAELYAGWDQVSVNDEDWSIDEDKSGIVHGVGVGYDVALSPKLIAGLEVEFDLASTKFDIADGDDLNAEIRAKRDIAVSARLGTKLGANVLAYAKAGYTNARIRGKFNDGANTEVLTENGDGLRVGAGLQVSLGKNAYVKAEYRYSNYEGGVTRNQVLTGLGIRF